MNKEMRVISAFGRGLDALKEFKSYKGFIGVSADYSFFQETSLHDYLEKYFESKKLRNYIEWSLKVVDGLLVYTSDWLLHYNLIAFEDMEEEEALDVSDTIGKFIEDKCNEIVLPFQTEKINFFRWSVSEDKGSDFMRTIKKVRDFSSRNERFAQHCLELTLTATHNKLGVIKERYGRERYKKALSVAHNYAIDDTGLMLHLYKLGSVSISKYEPPKPIKKFLYGDYPELYEILDLRPEEIGHIQTVVERDVIYNSWYDNEYEKIRVRR